MRKILVLVSSLGLVAASSLALAAPRPVEGLHDLPAKWTGVAGGLLSRVPATFTIDKVTKVDHQDPNHTGEYFSALYDVSASLLLGDRTLPVTQIGLSRYSADSQFYEVTIYTGDELCPTVFAAASYDEVSDSWTLQEMPRSANERRFIFHAPATGQTQQPRK